MKTNFKFLVTLLLGMVVLSSCVQDDDFDVPNTEPQEVMLNGSVISIGAVQGALAQSQDATFTFDDENDDTDTYMEGFVISSDEGGNFFEEIILQDAASNPTVGIKVLIDVNPLFTSYEFGRKVFIRLDGLTVGLTNGVLTLGIRDGDEAAKIPASLQNEVIVRSTEVAEIVPVEVSISDLDTSLLNQYIRLNNVQFNRRIVDNPDNPEDNDEATTYASEPTDNFDGERTLESCDSGASVVFSTSTFADFKGLNLPSGRGSIDAILTLNFFGDTFNVVVNSPETVNLTDPNRCDPEVVECTGASGGGAAFFFEDFENTSFTQLMSEGWTNQNVSGGNEVYELRSFSGNQYAQISAFNSDESEVSVYLVTPTINMDATTGEELSARIQANFDNGTILSVLVSSDFTGDASTATWTELDIDIPVGPSNTFGNFQDVGPVNISCLDGNVNFAFFYKGGDPSATTTYQVDDVEITGN